MKSIHFRNLSPGRTTAVALVLLALAIPTASAADLPLLGSPDLTSPMGAIGLIVVLAGAAALAGFAFARKLPGFVRSSPWLAVAIGVGLVGFAPGGAWASEAEPATSSAEVAQALTASNGYFATVDATFATREYFDNDAVVSMEIRLYDAAHGYTDKQMLEESVNPEYTVTTDGTTAEKEITSLPALRPDGTPYKWHAVVDKSGYYNFGMGGIWKDITFLVEKPALSTAQSGVPPIYTLKVLPIGDLDSSELATTYSANSAQFTFAVEWKNSDADGYVVAPAAKLTAATMTNIAFDNVATGQQCGSHDISSTNYIQYTGETTHSVTIDGEEYAVIGPSQALACNILLTTTSTTSDFGTVLDDLFFVADATNFNAHSNIRDMTAESEVNTADAS